MFVNELLNIWELADRFDNFYVLPILFSFKSSKNVKVFLKQNVYLPTKLSHSQYSGEIQVLENMQADFIVERKNGFSQ